MTKDFPLSEWTPRVLKHGPQVEEVFGLVMAGFHTKEKRVLIKKRIRGKGWAGTVDSSRTVCPNPPPSAIPLFPLHPPHRPKARLLKVHPGNLVCGFPRAAYEQRLYDDKTFARLEMRSSSI